MPVELIFKSDRTDLRNQISVYVNAQGFLCILTENEEDFFEPVVLDKSSAIKFSEELSKQISQMEDQYE